MKQLRTPNDPSQASCPSCWKAVSLCVCEVRPHLTSKTQFLILQHPRETRSPLGSARLLSLALPESSVHRVGLSWRSLDQAFGWGKQDPSEWAVLYLGTQKDSAPAVDAPAFEVRDRKGKPLPQVRLKGIVLLDGNWKQSKTLWWRNPWLLKLNRLLLNPAQSSRYGTLRRQPRARCLSTLEAGAESLHALGENQTSEALFAYFETFLEKARTAPREPKRPNRVRGFKPIAPGKPPTLESPPPASVH